MPSRAASADTETGDELREEIAAIEALVHAFETNTVRGG